MNQFFDMSLSFNSGLIVTLGPDRVYVWGQLMKTGIPKMVAPGNFGEVYGPQYFDVYCGF